MAYRMPAEWERHTRTWMSYPPPGGYVATLDPDARESWLVTANTVSEFEPVRLLVDSSDVEHVTDRVSAGVDVIEAELDDGWVRDNGPTFVVDEESSGLAAVHWTFNAWGAMAKSWEKDARLGGWIAGLADVPVLPSEMVNEGGGICVDGEGTVIITETVQLHDRRNPRWSKAEVEQELARTIGATTVIWLERGLMGDMQEFRPGVGTNGHVDVLAAFVRPGVVVVHGQPDPRHYDHEVMAENVRRLRASVDARGRELQIISIDAPQDTVVDAVSIDHSYINFSYVNGGLVMSTFGDAVADANAERILRELHPDRRVATVYAEPIFRNGGGVHCITQHEPEVTSAFPGQR